MSAASHPKPTPSLARLGLPWLVLVAIAWGMVFSSIGLTNSHGIAAVAASHESQQRSAVNAYGHEHADPEIEFLEADERSNGEHPHHSIDHSHDTAHPKLLAWDVISPQLPSWEVMVRPWIDRGQAYRLDRPPMG